MDKLKYIIDELNKIFSNDYNCFTFSNLTELQLLEVVIDLFYHLRIAEKTEKNHNQQSAALLILNTLEAVKYSPEEKTFPEDFRNGLLGADTRTIYPILDFLLRNKENVMKRHYLSRFVTKLEFPAELLKEDRNVGFMLKTYEKLIEDFWMCYGDNKREKTHALETAELEDDIWQMKLDATNLHNRLNLQKDKFRSQDITEKKLQDIREYCQETKRHAKIQKQLEDESSHLENLKLQLRLFKSRSEIRDLEDFLEAVYNNKHTSSMLCNSLVDLEADLQHVKRVGDEKEPDEEEMSSLHETAMYYKQAIKMLNHQKQSKTNDGIEAGLNQLKVLEKKHNVLSKQIIKIRLKNDSLLGKIEEVCALLGGDVLSGKSLKEYVAKLRQTSEVYKEFKRKLNSLQSEHGVLSRTVEILHLQDPRLKEGLESERKFLENLEIESNFASESEQKNKVRMAMNEYSMLCSQFLLENEKFKKFSAIFEEARDDFKLKKEKFDGATGNISEEIFRHSRAYDKLQEMIEMEMEDLNKYVEQAENYKESLLRYSHFFIENTSDASYIETVQHTLEMVESRREELLKQADEKNAVLQKQRADIDGINGVKEMLLLKISCGTYV